MSNPAAKAKYGNVILKDNITRKYAVVNGSTDLKTVFNIWQLKEPSVVLFVIDEIRDDESHHENLPNKIEHIISEGLIKTVGNNDSWVISSALDKNTPTLLSRAIDTLTLKSIVSIGITGLQSLDTKDILTRNALDDDDHDRTVVDHQLGQHASHFLLVEYSNSSFLDQDEQIYWKLKQAARNMFKPFPLSDVPLTFLLLPRYDKINVQTLQLAAKYDNITVLLENEDTTRFYQAVRDAIKDTSHFLFTYKSNGNTTRVYNDRHIERVRDIITTLKTSITFCEVRASCKPEDITQRVIESCLSKKGRDTDGESKIAILLDAVKIAKDIYPLTKNKLFSYLLRKAKKAISGERTDEQLMTKYLLGRAYHMHVWVNEGMDRSDLFIRSILLNEQELSKRIWTNGEDKIMTALLAYALLEAMAKTVCWDDVRIKLQKDAMEFNNMAIEELNDFYKKDDTRVLLRQSVNAKCRKAQGTISCFDFAHRTNNRDFISEPACQTLLDKLWFRKLSSNNGNLKLIACIIFPLLLLLPFLKIEFEDEEGEEDDRNESNRMKMSIGKKFFHFYRAPVIKFFNHTLSYLMFLGLYSYYLLMQLNEEVSSIDVVLTIWVFTILVEEIWELYTSTSCTNILVKLHNYFLDYWNILDFLAILLYAAGASIRYLRNDQYMDVARVILGINLLMFYSRLLHIFSVHRKMGPQLLIMAKMIWDLVYFMTIMVVIMVAFAVSSYAITHPNSEPSGHHFFDIFKHAFWSLFGEIFLEDIQLSEPECSIDPAIYNNMTLPRCPTDFGMFVGTVLIGLYSIVCIILMLNLLIAMFNYSVQIIQENNELYWKNQQYGLVHEYCKRLVLPPPLTPFVLIVNGIASLFPKRHSPPSIHRQFLEQYL